MKIYKIQMSVRFKEYGVKNPTTREVPLWVASTGDAMSAVKKATAWCMKKDWDFGRPLKATLLSVSFAGTVDVL